MSNFFKCQEVQLFVFLNVEVSCQELEKQDCAIVFHRKFHKQSKEKALVLLYLHL